MYAEYIIPGIFAVIVTIIEIMAARDRKETKAHQVAMEERAKQRADESLLSMELMDATAKTVKVIAKKILNQGKLNGDVEESMEALDRATVNYEHWKNELTAKKINKY